MSNEFWFIGSKIKYAEKQIKLKELKWNYNIYIVKIAPTLTYTTFDYDVCFIPIFFELLAQTL